MSKSETERSQMKKNTESISRNEESMEDTQKDQPKSKIKTILDFQSQPSNKTKIKYAWNKYTENIYAWNKCIENTNAKEQ